MTMQYRNYNPIVFNSTEPDRIYKSVFSGSLETVGEHNWRIVILRKTDMYYVGSCNIEPDKTFMIHMDNAAYPDESLVAMCFDNSGTYNADILDNISLCSFTYSVDVDAWANKLESEQSKTTSHDYMFGASNDKGVLLREKKNLPWLFRETIESKEYLNPGERLNFVFDEPTKGHFESNNIPAPPPPIGSILDIPGRPRVITIVNVTAIDGSDSSVEVETKTQYVGQADLETTGMTHDLFGDGTCVASGRFHNKNISIQGDYDMEFRSRHFQDYGDGTKDLQLHGEIDSNLLQDNNVKLQGYYGTLACTFPFPMHDGNITISWNMYWQDRGSDNVDLLTIDNLLRVRMYYDDMKMHTYSYGVQGALASASTLLVNTYTHFTLTFDDVGNRVRLYQNGVKKLDAAASDMNAGYAGIGVKQFLYFGGQKYDPGYRSLYISDFRLFHNRTVSDAEALTIYNDTEAAPAKAVYQIKKVTPLNKDIINRQYFPSVEGVNTSVSWDRIDVPGFAPLKGNPVPQLLLDSATFPKGEEYSTHTVSASDVSEAQTNFPLLIGLDNDKSPRLFEKGPDSWKYWEITQDGNSLQAEVIDTDTFDFNYEDDSRAFTSIRFICRNGYYDGATSGAYFGIRRITFYDENGGVIPWDESWVCEASSEYRVQNAARYAFDDSPYSGVDDSAGWRSNTSHNRDVELIVTFPTALKISKWRLWNWHDNGYYSDYGVMNITSHGLLTGKFDLLLETPPGAVSIYNGPVGKHDDDNSSEDTLVNMHTPIFEVSCVKFKTIYNYGNSSYTGIRRIEFFYRGVMIPYDDSWICEATSFSEEEKGADSTYQPHMAFWDDYDNQHHSPTNESWRSRRYSYNNQVLMVTFPSPIKFDEIKWYPYFNGTQETDVAARYIKVLMNTIDKDYVFPSVSNWLDGPNDEICIPYSHYVAQASSENRPREPVKIALDWSMGGLNYDTTKRTRESFINVKVPLLSAVTDTIIKIRSTDVDQEALGLIGLQGSENAKLVYDSTYEAVYNMTESLNPTLNPYSKLIDSKNGLHSIGGHVEGLGAPGDALFPVAKEFNHSTHKIDIPTPPAFATERLDTLSELSISAFVNQKEARLGSVFCLGNSAVSLENMSLDFWAVNINGAFLNNCRTPIFLDTSKLLTVTKTGNSYSLLAGDTLAGTDTNNSNARIGNAQRSITAKSVRFNCAGSLGSLTNLGFRSIDFYYKGVLVPYTVSWVFDATTSEPFYDPRSAFDPALPKIGAGVNNSFQSATGNVTNQVLVVTFLNQEVFDEIVINNFHDTGADIDKGISDLTIDVNPISGFDTVWDSTLAGTQRIFDGTLDTHPATNTESPQSPTIDNSTHLAKSVRFNFADNYGEEYISVNAILFWKDGVRVPWDPSWVCDETTSHSIGYEAKGAFDYTAVSPDMRDNGYTRWLSGLNSITNQVVTVSFPTALEFDDISYNNGNRYGDTEGRGVQNVTIDIHPTADFTTVWGAILPGEQRIYSGKWTKADTTLPEGLRHNDQAIQRYLGLNTDQSSVGASDEGDFFQGFLSRVMISNVARSLAWNTLMDKSLRGALVTHSETYGTTPEDYVRYGISFNNRITYVIWTGSAWKPVVSKDPAIHGVVDDYDWYYRQSGAIWSKDLNNTKESAFSNAVNETTNRMTKDIVEAITAPEWVSLNGFSDDGHFDVVASVYQSPTVTSIIKDVAIDHSKKVAVMPPIDLEVYDGTIESSFVQWVFEQSDKPRFSFAESKARWDANWKCYVIITGGDWVEITNRDSIPGLTPGMITAGKIMQFKFEWTKGVWYNKQEILPLLQWTIKTV